MKKDTWFWLILWWSVIHLPHNSFNKTMRLRQQGSKLDTGLQGQEKELPTPGGKLSMSTSVRWGVWSQIQSSFYNLQLQWELRPSQSYCLIRHRSEGDSFFDVSAKLALSWWCQLSPDLNGSKSSLCPVLISSSPACSWFYASASLCPLTVRRPEQNCLLQTTCRKINVYLSCTL